MRALSCEVDVTRANTCCGIGAWLGFRVEGSRFGVQGAQSPTPPRKDNQSTLVHDFLLRGGARNLLAVGALAALVIPRVDNDRRRANRTTHVSFGLNPPRIFTKAA